jgi:hypothetical protein
LAWQLLPVLELCFAGVDSMSVSSVGYQRLLTPATIGPAGSGSIGGAAPELQSNFGPAVQISLSALAQAAMNGASANPTGQVTDALNALTRGGLSSNNVNYSGAYKQQLFNIADVNQNGVVTQTELEQQVTAGGGTAAQSDALYAAVHTNGGDGVTEQQFSQSLATPADNNFGHQLLKLIDPNGQMTASAA